MTERRRGMDHQIYAYAPLPERAALRWPDGAQLAFWVLLHLEYWEMAPPEDAIRDSRFKGEFGNFFPDYRTWSYREYGNRIGIYRIMELLDRYGLKATVAVNAMACERYPELLQEFTNRGWEIAAHGISANRMITSKMSEEEERRFIADSIAPTEQAAGHRPSGWLSQDFGHSPRTTRLVAEAGMSYIMDWPNDDQPYMTTDGKPLVSIPHQLEWDDVHLLWMRRLPMPRYPEIVQEAFDSLHEEGATSARLFGLSIHPWVLGASHRIRYLDEALSRIAGREGVWQAAAGEIASEYLRQAAG